MARNEKKYLFDIQYCISRIEYYIPESLTYEAFSQDTIVQDAVERRLITIGEAVSRLRQMGVILTQTDRLINRRNTLIHQYDEYTPKTIWLHVKDQLPLLKIEVDSLLGNDVA